ncbi:uncharacterized protein GGS22DRAFT_197254 [Annulohypoxylon maeteangense]|uniref:uncharacterized protein n=1 Tax=Annulohypoxylon maeteangense TaxID=1927788 RepID=UPI002007FC4E|nr:uncharacterized protein GGS22DRAFT_197254 [Annulohypoxylon maeteangense]KAI0880922.1 hypothetical protein GGS22DRAFT_197254 [Annulohypoxylon maeteangense]
MSGAWKTPLRVQADNPRKVPRNPLVYSEATGPGLFEFVRTEESSGPSGPAEPTQPAEPAEPVEPSDSEYHSDEGPAPAPVDKDDCQRTIFPMYLRVRPNPANYPPDAANHEQVIVLVLEETSYLVEKERGAIDTLPQGYPKRRNIAGGEERHSAIVFHLIRNEHSTSTLTVRSNRDGYTSQARDWETLIDRDDKSARGLKITDRAVEDSRINHAFGPPYLSHICETGTHVDITREVEPQLGPNVGGVYPPVETYDEVESVSARLFRLSTLIFVNVFCIVISAVLISRVNDQVRVVN